MVRPPTRQLSALKLPWQKPTRSQPPIIAASLSPKASSSACALTSVDASGSATRSGYSRNNACSNISSNSSRRCSSSGSLRARRAKRSRCPTRKKLGATRVVMAQASSTIMSGSRFCLSIARLCSAGNLASRGSSSVISLYHGRWVVSSPETTSDSARVVSTPRRNIASLARNSRMEERSTARPSARRQKGVGPPPFSCISHRCPPTVTSPTLMARPSPYPLPFPKGQLVLYGSPIMLSA
mmetsp:Transcript_9604/g.17302  ORF Transcript_9604/g.17302 Transcript_9604/m.17302 type:complete len:240 (+) Transcript_9604:31-750(+)